MLTHPQIDARSLAFDAVVAVRVAREPALLERARANLARWLETCSPRSRPALLEWQAILDACPAEVDRLLRATDERATRLRQSSPFAGEAFITRAERNEIIRRFRDAAP